VPRGVPHALLVVSEQARLLDLVHLPKLRARYGADLLLVRPDQHVAWRGTADADADAVLDVVTGRGTRPTTVAGQRTPAATRG